jgi:PDZ domain-containing protein
VPPRTTMAPIAKTQASKALTVTPNVEAKIGRSMSENNDVTMPNSVPLPPPTLAPTRPDRAELRKLWWALPLLTCAWLALIGIVVAASIQVRFWEVAPGSAEPVANRLEFTKEALAHVTRYPSTNSVLFVTAFGGQLSALETFVGSIDADVDVQSFEERFGKSTPGTQQQLGFQSMTTAKQIAEYVAFTKLGLDASFELGSVVVEEVVCLDIPVTLSACKQLLPGDTLTVFDGKAIPTLAELAPLMEGYEPGDIVTIGVIPHMATEPEDRRVQLIESPDEPGRTIIGFIPADTRTVVLPFEVSIDTDRIGGPSAGLAFTLALLDELTPGDLFGGVKVAATGTMNEDETVGAIGALPQKAVAVKAAGAKLFIVPKSQSPEELAAARAVLGSAVKLVTVENLDEALALLESLGGSGLTNATISL